MTDVKYIHHLFKLKMNKLDTGVNYDYPPAFIDTILWEALNEYIEIFYSGNTKQYKLGFEVTQQRMDMLKDYLVSYPDIPALTYSTTQNFSGVKLEKYNLASLSQKYKHIVKCSGLDSSCANMILIDIEPFNNIDKMLLDEFNKPKARWYRGKGHVVKDNLFIYVENNLSELYISYLKIPIKPFFGGYNTLEYIQGDLTAPSTLSPQINIELSPDYAGVLTNIMVEIASSNVNDFQKQQIFEQKIISI